MKEAPYGSWTSPITVDLITGRTVRLSHCGLDGTTPYWVEMRPYEAGRSVLATTGNAGGIIDLTPKEVNVRTAVHEYGGGAALLEGGTAYFSSYPDHKVFRQRPGHSPEVIAESTGSRFADFVVDAGRNRLIAIREEHLEGAEPRNTVCAIPLDGSKAIVTLADGHDFFSSARLSQDGKKLAWITWDHPNMPWDESRLWMAEVKSDGTLANRVLVTGEGESVLQPQWGPDGTLYFICDRSGWWNLYSYQDGRITHLVDMDADFGVPHWIFGLSTYAALSSEKLVCSYVSAGRWHLAELSLPDRSLDSLDLPYEDISFLKASGNTVIFRGGSPRDCAGIVRLDMATGHYETLRRSTDVELDSAYISVGRPIEFETSEGTAHAFFYEPKNKDFRAPRESKPPLIVKSHGGPTSACVNTLEPGIQYWTSRGFAVVDVNYAGSTGFGRIYRKKLEGRWGIQDVDDCENAARHLVVTGRVDPDRLAISGGSAGGYTTLCALTFRNTFKCGASYYGVSDLESLAKDTHKFESRYLDSLVGPYPDGRDTYIQRSPINYADRVDCPVIFFQGEEDKVVPPAQSESMVNALKGNGIPVAYLTFPGEQHGFRKSDTIKRCLEAELSFYCKIFGIARPDFGNSLEIANLETATI